MAKADKTFQRKFRNTFFMMAGTMDWKLWTHKDKGGEYVIIANQLIKPDATAEFESGVLYTDGTTVFSRTKANFYDRFVEAK